MRHAGWVAFLAIAAVGCHAAPSEEAESTRSSVSNQFFEQAKRRDPSAIEAQRVAFVSTGCTAFFLENTKGKVYLATARHCVEFQLSKWCAGEGAADGAFTDTDGKAGRCIRVVAADRTHDIAVVETNLAHASTGRTTLRLAAFNPPAETRLVMTGFPFDQDPGTARNGAITTTENCWTMGPPVESPYAQQDTNTLDLSMNHNCTTYGGNSGGPMYKEGTRDVIGMPFTYRPDDYERYSQDDLQTAAFVALSSDFVEVHKAKLDAAGIVTSTAFTPDIDTATPEDVPGEGSEEIPGTDVPETTADTPKPTKKPKPKPSKSSSDDDEDEEASDDGTAPVATAGCAASGGPTGGGWFIVAVALIALRAVCRRRGLTP